MGADRESALQREMMGVNHMLDRTLRHLPFFEALSGMTEESAEWRATSAGLVTLRLVDGWLARGGSEPGGDGWGLTAVRSAINAIEPTSQVRTILAGIAEAIATPGAADVSRVAPRLMAYGRTLDFAGQWPLAADVYEMVIALTNDASDADLAIDANFRLAYCRRVLGELEVAEQVYARAGHLAGAVHDVARVLRAEVGVAKVATARGNLPAAAKMLDATIARAATRPELTQIRALAMHDRAAVAHQGRDFELAIRLLYEALPGVGSPSARDRVLADIANAFLQLGVRSAARDALLVIAATAEEQFSRWSATINLMYIAALDGFEPVFEQHRRSLTGAALTPELRADYALAAARGYRLFDHVDAARDAFRGAIAVADGHGINRVVFEAEQELEELERGVVRRRHASAAVPPTVEEVALAMEELRLAAVS